MDGLMCVLKYDWEHIWIYSIYSLIKEFQTGCFYFSTFRDLEAKFLFCQKKKRSLDPFWINSFNIYNIYLLVPFIRVILYKCSCWCDFSRLFPFSGIQGMKTTHSVYNLYLRKTLNGSNCYFGLICQINDEWSTNETREMKYRIFITNAKHW